MPCKSVLYIPTRSDEVYALMNTPENIQKLKTAHRLAISMNRETAGLITGVQLFLELFRLTGFPLVKYKFGNENALMKHQSGREKMHWIVTSNGIAESTCIGAWFPVSELTSP